MEAKLDQHTGTDGLLNNFKKTIRRIAKVPHGGTAPKIIIEKGTSPPRMELIKTQRGTAVNAVFVGKQWVFQNMEEEMRRIYQRLCEIHG